MKNFLSLHHPLKFLKYLWFFSIGFLCCNVLESKVDLGIDVFLKEKQYMALKNKKIGLVTNHTGVSSDLRSTIELFKEEQNAFILAALFCPEHGLKGVNYAAEKVENSKDISSIPIYSLHGSNRRPTEKMLKDIDVLIFDIQDIGSRSYTYVSTLFYVMEEAAKRQIPVIVLDRPNPLGGNIVDGPMLSEGWRSFLGYINVPYCHGMTIGELALFFNKEYKIHCSLKVIPMKGWERWMSFKNTGLHWIPTSPQIPEADTPFFYASTGILGELSLVNIGIGYTQPFKLVGAPWIQAEVLAKKLNAQKLPGVKFIPFYFRPMFGLYAKQDCEGVKIIITDEKIYRPLSVQYLLMGVLKTLYPAQVNEKLNTLSALSKKMFCQVNGNDEMLKYLSNERYAAWKMIEYQKEERKLFIEKRKKYLLY